jgi:hypothetical protein
MLLCAALTAAALTPATGASTDLQTEGANIEKWRIELEDDMVSPGAIVFKKNGQEVRLDTVLDGDDATDLFVMFADGTSGHDTYGAGRFLHIPFATDGKTVVDFNKAYNPPCAFNDFATCPLPPYQNRVKLKVTAGEKKYAGGH